MVGDVGLHLVVLRYVIISLICPESVYEAVEKVRHIRERLRKAQSRQNSYADVRRRDVEF